MGPKLGFGGHKGSKKKKKDKKKKDKHSSDSDSDSDDEHKHKKGGLQIGIEGGVEHKVKVDKADVDINVNANIGAGGNAPDADMELGTDGNIVFDGNVSLPSNEGKHHDGEIKVTTPEIK